MVRELKHQRVLTKQANVDCINGRHFAFFRESSYGVGFQDKTTVEDAPIRIAREGRILHGRHVVRRLAINTSTGGNAMIALQAQGIFARL